MRLQGDRPPRPRRMRPADGICRGPAARALRIGVIAAAGSALAAGGAAGSRAPAGLFISLASHTVRLVDDHGITRLFPAAVGRRTSDGRRLGLRGTAHLGADVADPRFYAPARSAPKIYGGHPYLRLDGTAPARRGRRTERAAAQGRVFGIHGPITPSLVWGAVTAGCIRMRPADLAKVYDFAVGHPGLPVTISSKPDPRARQLRAHLPGCDGRGVRPLGRLRGRDTRIERQCPGTDHWFAIELQGGDLLRVQADGGPPPKIELYGIRLISRVVGGRGEIELRVPHQRHNRGDRFLRVVAPAHGPARSYTLRLDLLR